MANEKDAKIQESLAAHGGGKERPSNRQRGAGASAPHQPAPAESTDALGSNVGCLCDWDEIGNVVEPANPLCPIHGIEGWRDAPDAIEKDALRRYSITLVVETTDDEAPGLAVAIAAAVDCQHVGPISISPAEHWSWDE